MSKFFSVSKLEVHIQQNCVVFSACMFQLCFRELEFQYVHCKMSNMLDVVGFLDIAEVASPPTLSRHLILPTSTRERSVRSENNGVEGMQQHLDAWFHLTVEASRQCFFNLKSFRCFEVVVVVLLDKQKWIYIIIGVRLAGCVSSEYSPMLMESTT